MAWKRLIDLIIGVPATIIAVPILLLIAALVIATSGWPAFIVQTRVGASEHPIRVVKVRTMRRDAPLVAKSELRDPGSVATRLGPVLRRSSLDELPQLWNVIRGDMSLVGPRPALPSQHDLLELRRKHGIIALKPGLTGLAQVLGRESLTLSTKVRAEALYARRRSAGLDIRILFWTLRAVLFGRGAY